MVGMGQRGLAHSFAESLQASHQASDLPIWREIYEQAFPGFLAMHDHRQDGDHQRQGIDRSVILENSKQVLIDEKVRGRNKKTGKVYDDIALEYWSDFERKQKGWVCKPLLCDYIAYAIAPLGKGYLLPVLQLQLAWGTHGQSWIAQYPEIRAINRGWTTVSVGVPVSVLFPKIGEALRCAFDPVEVNE